MPTILPFSELVNKKEEVLKLCREKQEPVFLTNEGYGDMVLISQKLYDKLVSGALAAVSAAEPASSEDDEEAFKSRVKKLARSIDKMPLEDVVHVLEQQIKKEKRI